MVRESNVCNSEWSTILASWGTNLGFQSLILGFWGTTFRTSNCLGLLSSRTVQLNSPRCVARFARGSKTTTTLKSNSHSLEGLRPPIHPSGLCHRTPPGDFSSPDPMAGVEDADSRCAPFVRFRHGSPLPKCHFLPASRRIAKGITKHRELQY